jgi:hypothetical protein
MNAGELGILLGVAASGTYLLAQQFPKLKPPSAYGIVKFELTWRSRTAREILADWKSHGVIARARTSIALDWAFIPAYSSTLALAAILLGRAADADSLAGAAACGAWVAGGLDLVENIGLLRMLAGHTDQPVPLFTSVVSLAKWLLIAATGVAILVLAIRSLF